MATLGTFVEVEVESEQVEPVTPVKKIKREPPQSVVKLERKEEVDVKLEEQEEKPEELNQLAGVPRGGRKEILRRLRLGRWHEATQ